MAVMGRILGVDPGSLITGYGVIESGGGGSCTLITNGELTLKKYSSLPERLLAIKEGLCAVIKEYKPASMAVESLFFAKNARSAIVLAHARGAVLLSAAEFGLKVHEYDPRKIKLAITGYGNADKAQVGKMVSALLNGVTPAGTDASDAIATAICHMHHAGGLAAELGA